MTDKKQKKLAHLFDATQCVGCSACIVACAQTNYPDMLTGEVAGWEWLPSNIRKVTVERARRPVQILVQCQQCENAPCISTCPFGANYHDPETGLVKTDPSRCVGCNYCIASCPYDVRWSHPETGLPMKCMGEGCHELVEQGQDPACVAVCPVHARMFGDVSDPESPISRKLRAVKSEKLLPEKGTKPNFFVVVSK
ncbi:4Fe-4S dicluster domain-containing protein [Sutterella megalosphaeroides]|uniref:4Fe-4S ferredoxin n=1 Tax=Sutterella megalosphaeroides TaxID=2494234 RepID=A0A2Z6IEF3_9BURK|nr:4Fe-4S dicluster domain-containing protein [Sutterella megalosphaeroides]BBF23608.1 4Fe-4S ferredoxin [Sutterella megalosphaeroides]